MASYKITQTTGGGGVIFQIQLVGTYSSQIDKVEIILTTDSHGNNLYEKLAEITPTGALIKVYVPWEDIMQYKVDELELYTFIKGSASSQTVPGSTKYLTIREIQDSYGLHGPQGWLPLPRVTLTKWS